MNHTFVGSITDPEKCRQCKRTEIAHGKQAECESCGNANGPCNIIDGDILACEECEKRDVEIREEIKSLGDTREERVANTQAIMNYNNRIQHGIRVITDIFNAKTVAIVKLGEAINADPNVPDDQKSFRLSQIIDERFTHLEDAIKNTKASLADMENEQVAIQQYYNALSKKLRAEEKDKIRLKDLTYQITEPTLKKPKAPSTKSTSAKDAQPWVEKLETEFPAMKGTIASALQAIIVAQSKTPEAAYNIFRGMLGKT